MNVNSPDALRDALGHVRGRAGADLAAAAAAMLQVQREKSDVDSILAGMRAHRFPASAVRMVAALLDALSREMAGCRAHGLAAAGKFAAAGRAVEMADEHRQFQGQGAAGQFYARPVVSDEVKQELVRRALSSLVGGADVALPI